MEVLQSGFSNLDLRLTARVNLENTTLRMRTKGGVRPDCSVCCTSRHGVLFLQEGPCSAWKVPGRESPQWLCLNQDLWPLLTHNLHVFSCCDHEVPSFALHHCRSLPALAQGPGSSFLITPSSDRHWLSNTSHSPLAPGREGHLMTLPCAPFGQGTHSCAFCFGPVTVMI